jgi:TRAP-type C4-dicarboxylate transport system permease small subunit
MEKINFTTRICMAAKSVSWFCCFIAALATIFLILLTVSDVVLRFVLSKPIDGTFELTEYLMVVIVFFAFPWATMRGVHVRVDLLTGRFSKKTQAVLYGISCVLSMLITFCFGWYTYPEAMYAYDLQFKSDMLNIPSYPFYFIIMISFFILLFTLLAVFLQYIKEVFGK